MRDDQKVVKDPALSQPTALTADRRKTTRMEEPASAQLIFLDTYTRGNLLLDRVTIAMAQFEADTKRQHDADPESFPLMRTEDNWWNEFRAWVAYDYAVTVMGVVDTHES